MNEYRIPTYHEALAYPASGVFDTYRDQVLASCRALIAEGASPDAPRALGRTAVHRAAQGGWEDVLRLFARYGALIDAADHAGATPLHLAAAEGWAGAVGVLVRRGADPQARDDAGRTPADCARLAHHSELAQRLGRCQRRTWTAPKRLPMRRAVPTPQGRMQRLLGRLEDFMAPLAGWATA